MDLQCFLNEKQFPSDRGPLGGPVGDLILSIQSSEIVTIKSNLIHEINNNFQFNFLSSFGILF